MELGGSQSDALDQSVLAQETGGRLSSAGPWAGRGREGLRTRAGAHWERSAKFEGAPWGWAPELPLAPVETSLPLRLAVRRVAGKAAGPRSASAAAPARSGQAPPPPARGPAHPETCGSKRAKVRVRGGSGREEGTESEWKPRTPGRAAAGRVAFRPGSKRGGRALGPASGGASRRGWHDVRMRVSTCVELCTLLPVNDTIGRC